MAGATASCSDDCCASASAPPAARTHTQPNMKPRFMLGSALLGVQRLALLMSNRLQGMENCEANTARAAPAG